MRQSQQFMLLHVVTIVLLSANISTEVVAETDEPPSQIPLQSTTAPQADHSADQPADFALQFALALTDANDKILALEIIAKAQANANDKQAALTTLQHSLSIAQEMDSTHRKVHHFVSIAQMMARWEYYEHVVEIQQNALWVARESADAGERAGLLRAATYIPLHADNNRQMRDLLNESLIATRQIEDPGQRDVSFEDTSRRLVVAGAIEQAVAIANEISGQFKKNRALADIAVQLAEAGNHQRALQLAMTIADVDSNITTLTKIAAVLVKAGSQQLALATLDQALGQIPNVNSASHKVDLLDRIADVQILAGDNAQALQTLQRARALVPTIEKTYLQNRAYASIASSLTDAGEYRQARVVIETIEPVSLSDRPLVSVAKKLSTSADFQAALQLVELIDDVSYKISALCAIATDLAFAGQQEQATATLKAAVASLNTANAANTTYYSIFKSGALWEIAPALAFAGNGQQALQRALQIEDADIKEYALEDVARALITTGDLRTAVEAIQKLDDPGRKSQLLIQHLAPAQTKAGDNASAFVSQQQALEFARLIEPAASKALVIAQFALDLATAADHNAKRGQYDRLPARRMKSEFTSQEKQLAKQLIAAFRES